MKNESLIEQEGLALIEQMRNRPGEIILDELIQQAFKIFANKLANGGIIAENEFAFQFELGTILKTLGQLYEFKLEDKFHLEFETNILLNKESSKSKTKKARVDLLIKYKLDNKTTQAAIELKYFRKKNNREPNNRYDIFTDISNLEYYKDNIEICYFLLITDHQHYVDKEAYSPDTSDFDVRHGKTYKANTNLSYRTPNKPKKYETDILLTQNYNFKWRTLGDFYFLILKV
ncbi:hypothetical protein [Confluentibacter sediminis]|uniref:hypothetical protein n=1 Tax=Confluentibacter sediminis TaxID=2219045 RepID=UPI001F2EBBF3|nr:hypothetical protein [Confluentibacter sediminis]